MHLRWTTPATQDLYNIVHRIQRDNPEAAAKVAETLYDGCSSLGNFPRRGRKGRIEGTRELVFAGLPYIIVYRIEDQNLEILRIYHGAQDWP
ncbi:MAG: type II toxin-antitoxin system RelE/ParE family toxin [Terriglobales bacterium]|jgi:toxin ParE1/3/4